MFEIFNPIDYWLVEALGQLSQQSRIFDESVILIEKIEFLKGGVLTALLWYLWFQPTDNSQHRHEQVLRIIFGGILAVFASQIIQDIAPWRPLPLGHPDVAFIPLLGQDTGSRNFWNGFPSDTSLFTYGLTTGIWILSRRLGLFALLWTSIVVILPRLYLGYHFLSDILTGAAIGIAIVIFALWIPLPRAVPAGLHRLEQRLPHWFYLAGFILSFQLAGTFADVRTITKLYPTDLGDASRHIPWCERNTAEPKSAPIWNFQTPDGTRGRRSSQALIRAAYAASKAGDEDAAFAWALACQAHSQRVRDEMTRDRAIILDYLRTNPGT